MRKRQGAGPLLLWLHPQVARRPAPSSLRSHRCYLASEKKTLSGLVTATVRPATSSSYSSGTGKCYPDGTQSALFSLLRRAPTAQPRRARRRAGPRLPPTRRPCRCRDRRDRVAVTPTREEQRSRPRVAPVHDLVRSGRTSREADEIAALERVLAVGGAHDDRPLDYEQPLLVVLVVVRRRALAGLEVVDEHEEVGGAERLRYVDAARVLGLEGSPRPFGHYPDGDE